MLNMTWYPLLVIFGAVPGFFGRAFGWSHPLFLAVTGGFALFYWFRFAALMRPAAWRDWRILNLSWVLTLMVGLYAERFGLHGSARDGTPTDYPAELFFSWAVFQFSICLMLLGQLAFRLDHDASAK